MVTLISGNWWGALSNTQQIFWTIAIVFSILLLIQLVLSMIGLEFDDADVNMSTSAEDSSGAELGGDFSLISVRSIIAFFTLFGWAGVMLLNAGKPILTTVLLSSLAGFIAMISVAYLLYLLSKLGESGNVDLTDAIFQIAEVYLSIPPAKSGQGKVHIEIQGALKELDAITEGNGLPTGSNVRILEVLDNNLLLVESVEQYNFS
ncbi:MAG: hypothetical protein ACI8YQ_000613 [Polaribacter sp.]|jgi:hypothetical protein